MLLTNHIQSISKICPKFQVPSSRFLRSMYWSSLSESESSVLEKHWEWLSERCVKRKCLAVYLRTKYDHILYARKNLWGQCVWRIDSFGLNLEQVGQAACTWKGLKNLKRSKVQSRECSQRRRHAIGLQRGSNDKMSPPFLGCLDRPWARVLHHCKLRWNAKMLPIWNSEKKTGNQEKFQTFQELTKNHPWQINIQQVPPRHIF